MYNKDNYRGISLLSVIAKLYEKLLLTRYQAQKITINELEGACKRGCSNLHTAMMLQELIAYNKECKYVTYVSLLDTKKAFDTVWHPGLFLKLYKNGCNRVIWDVLWSYYDGFTSCVFTPAGYSDWFQVCQGIHQGGTFSMELYIMCNNDLLNSLQTMGAKIHTLRVSCPAYADDIAAVATHKPALQEMLDYAYDHSRKWRYDYNPQKSTILIFGRDSSPSYQFKLGDHVIPQVDSDTHLGVPLVTSMRALNTRIEERISAARRSFHLTLSLGIHRHPVPPTIVSKLYCSVVIPQMLYGIELNYSENVCRTLEAAHIKMAKRTQGLSTTAASPSALPSLGWRSIRATLMYRSLLMLWQILLLPMSSLYKQIVIHRIFEFHGGGSKHSCGPVFIMYNTLVRLNIHDEVMSAIRTANYMTLGAWKKKVKNLIHNNDLLELRAKSLMYSTMSLYQDCIKDIKIWPWWQHASANPKDMSTCILMMKLLVNDYDYPSGKRFNGDRRWQCDKCAQYTLHKLGHRFFECNVDEHDINISWRTIEGVCPPALWKEMTNMGLRNKCIFILSGFRSSYIVEWHFIYQSICAHIHLLHNAHMLDVE